MKKIPCSKNWPWEITWACSARETFTIARTVPAGQQFTGDGIFYHNSAVKFRDIRDGLSHTFMVGERSSALGFSTWVGSPANDDCGPGMVLGIGDRSAQFAGIRRRIPIRTISAAGIRKGTNFCSADGSVRLVDQNIDDAVYKALCTRAAGDSIGDFLSN